MKKPCSLIAVAGLVTAAIVAAAPAADTPTPKPVVTMTARVSPGRLPIPPGTPLAMRVHMELGSVPAGTDFVLERVTLLFGRGARVNGALFPSCSAAKLRGAHGRLSACPKGSKIGSGVATGKAVAVGIRSSGRLTIFNGRGGRSVVLNLVVVSPVLINVTFEAPFVRLRGGRYGFKLTTVLPPELRSVLDGDVVAQRLDFTTGATLTIDGRRRGYFEAASCPRRGSPIHAEFQFSHGARASADQVVVC